MLTDREIRTARVPATRNQLDPRDGQIRGLVLRVYRSGAKTWFIAYRRKEDNRRRWMKIGVFPGLSHKDARDRAGIELGRIAGGEDPLAERRESSAVTRCGPGRPTTCGGRRRRRWGRWRCRAGSCKRF